MRWKTVLFDLDGTLFDTSPGIIACLRRALRAFGIDGGSDREMHRFIGPPIVEAMQTFYGMSEEEAHRVKDIYRRDYRETGVYECAPFEGAEKCLRALRLAGVALGVATSKPIEFAAQILERFGFRQYFSAVSGALSDAASAKETVVRAALAELGVREGEPSCVMVGDRKYDVEGAAACGLRCIGLDSGFAEEGEFERAGALAVVRNYGELTEILLGQN